MINHLVIGPITVAAEKVQQKGVFFFFSIMFYFGLLPPPVGWSAKPQQNMPGRLVGRYIRFIGISQG